jgi:hypothetical protein
MTDAKSLRGMLLHLFAFGHQSLPDRTAPSSHLARCMATATNNEEKYVKHPFAKSS